MKNAYEVLRVVGDELVIVASSADLNQAKRKCEKLAHDESGYFCVRDQATRQVVYVHSTLGTRQQEES